VPTHYPLPMAIFSGNKYLLEWTSYYYGESFNDALATRRIEPSEHMHPQTQLVLRKFNDLIITDFVKCHNLGGNLTGIGVHDDWFEFIFVDETSIEEVARVLKVFYLKVVLSDAAILSELMSPGEVVLPNGDAPVEQTAGAGTAAE
jgi:hypothetical protein